MKRSIISTFLCLAVYFFSWAQPTVNGDISDSQYLLLASAGSNNGFGNQNDLGVLKFFTTNSTLYVGITGRLSDANNIVVFMDFENYNGRDNQTLGGNSTSNIGVFSTSTNPGDCGGNGGLNGAILDNGFDADYAFAFNRGNTNTNFYLDVARFNDASNPNGYNYTGYVGACDQNGTPASFSLEVGGTGNITFAFRSDYDPNTQSQSGVEFAIPYSALPGTNFGDVIKFFVVITNNFGFMSDESIPGDITGGNPGCDANLSSQAATLYTTSTTLPVSFTQFLARVADGNVYLRWEANESNNLHYYVVERSANGNAFVRMSEVFPSMSGAGVGVHRWTDYSPLSGTNFYRIVAVGHNGDHRYSPVQRVQVNTTAGSFKVWPAASGDHIVLSMRQLPAGNYNFQLFNSSGQIVYSRNVQFSGDQQWLQLPLTSPGGKGVYHAILKKEGAIYRQSVVW